MPGRNSAEPLSRSALHLELIHQAFQLPRQGGKYGHGDVSAENG